MAVSADVIVGVVANVANAVSDQQALLRMLPRIQRARAKQSPAKKDAVAIAMAAPSVLKQRAVMQMLQASSQAMLLLPLMAMQRRMAVMNAGVAVAIDVVVVAGNAPSAVKVVQKQMQPQSPATRLVAHGLHRAWLDHRQPFLRAN
jgi:hypothetical protein